MPENDLNTLLRKMRPDTRPGEYVFVTAPDAPPADVELLATVVETEGPSAVLARGDADSLGLEYDFVAAWITLRVESALSAIGLTAAVSRCLTERGISCNVIAGLRHDHLLVPVDRAGEAIEALHELSRSATG